MELPMNRHIYTWRGFCIPKWIDRIPLLPTAAKSIMILVLEMVVLGKVDQSGVRD
jgi:hypothetical protein